MITNHKPLGYFSEETIQHLIPRYSGSSRWLLRSVEATLACKLTLVYGRYHLMMDLRSLAISEHQKSYEHAELMASFLNHLLPSHHTTPSDLIHSKEEYTDESIDVYNEYDQYLELFKSYSSNCPCNP